MFDDDNRMTPLERRATWGLGAVFSLRMLGMFMVLPVLTTYGMTLAGASEILIGIAIGIYGLTQAIFQIPFGLASDKIGRKPLIIGGLLIFAAGSMIAALSDSIWGIILGRALQGAGAIAAAVMALLSDLTREQNRTKAMAVIGVSFGVTFALAMVLGPIITHAWGLHALFWGITFLTLIAIAITLLFVPNAPTHVLNRESGIVKGGYKKIFKHRALLKLNLGIFCLHTLLMAAFVALPPTLQQAGISADKQWRPYLVTMLIAFITVIPAIFYAEKRRKMRSVFLFCILLLGIAQTVLWQAQLSLLALIIGLQLFFIAFNIMEALLPSLISKESPAGYKGTAMGLYATSQFMGVALGGSLGGWLFSFNGSSGVFLGGLLLTLLWLLISLTMREPPYVSSLRIELPTHLTITVETLREHYLSQPGVTEAIVIPQECAAYIKVDTQQTNRKQLELLTTSLLST